MSAIFLQAVKRRLRPTTENRSSLNNEKTISMLKYFRMHGYNH